jgi:hypothetical protein
LGETYLTNVDFLKNGIPASIIACLVRGTSPLFFSPVSHQRRVGGRYRWVCIDETYWVSTCRGCQWLNSKLINAQVVIGAWGLLHLEITDIHPSLFPPA